ncbi:MAG: hypothetical protein L6R48_19130 [Planctomycetes bacterium]|nr:hypothetical protein [Planctomycetota bacterium]
MNADRLNAKGPGVTPTPQPPTAGDGRQHPPSSRPSNRHLHLIEGEYVTTAKAMGNMVLCLLLNLDRREPRRAADLLPLHLWPRSAHRLFNPVLARMAKQKVIRTTDEGPGDLRSKHWVLSCGGGQ